MALGFTKLRLSQKLALSLSVAAVLPIMGAGLVAQRIVLGSLETGLEQQTSRQLSIAVNLVLRNVQRAGTDAVKLASTPSLIEAIESNDVSEVLAFAAPQLPSSLVQIADSKGNILEEQAIGGNERRFRLLHLQSGAPMIKRGLEYERRVNILAGSDSLVVRGVAPVVDPGFGLRGAVVLSLPLDGDFADQIKGALGAHVMIHNGASPALSSFIDDQGARMTGLVPPEGVAEAVLAGGTIFVGQTINGREYSVGYAPLKNLDEESVGMLGVAVERDAFVHAQAAAEKALVVGAASAFLFALVLAAFLSRRLTSPLARLHAGALAVARGDLRVRIPVVQGDEIGDLASAFSTMTDSLRENQERLAARMREIVALHEAGHAVSSVLGLEEVLTKIVDSVARVLDTQVTTLWLVEPGTAEMGTPVLRIGAARAKSPRGTFTPTEEATELGASLMPIAEEVARARLALRIDSFGDEERWREAAAAAQVTGSLLGVPLERASEVIGVLIVGRPKDVAAFGDADESLLGTFADQAATAVENARLYEEVRAFSGEMEKKVVERTQELTAANEDLEKTLTELRETQSQLLLSERMAGLGSLVAGVAHEINSPSAAIRGSVDALHDNMKRLSTMTREVDDIKMNDDDRQRFLELTERLAPKLADKRVASPTTVRRRRRKLKEELAKRGWEDPDFTARVLSEAGVDSELDELLPLLEVSPNRLVSFFQESVYLHRNVESIQNAILQIQRIVGALKSYSHLDQARVEPTDLHEGIENTLVMLNHELKYGIDVVRKYQDLPMVPVYVDELNQVWTNLIHNAAQALGGKGEITIETHPPEGDEIKMVGVSVVDTGPGISEDVLPHIFEPFYTTKSKGEGTGLGLGIVKKIVDKHSGRVEVASRPGQTCFTVWLPVDGPPEKTEEASG